MELCEVINKLYNKVYKEEENKSTEENKNTNKETFASIYTQSIVLIQ